MYTIDSMAAAVAAVSTPKEHSQRMRPQRLNGITVAMIMMVASCMAMVPMMVASASAMIDDFAPLPRRPAATPMSSSSLFSSLSPSLTSSSASEEDVIADAVLAASYPQMHPGHIICESMDIFGAEARSVCWIANNGTLLCDRNHLHDWPSLNAAGAHFVSISCGTGVCALDSEGRVHCMGALPLSMSNKMDNIPFGSFTSISLNPKVDRICGVQQNGNGQCWTALRYDDSRPMPTGRWRVLQHASQWVCGLTLLENKLDCFGYEKQLYEPAAIECWWPYVNITTWVSMACGHDHCCGLTLEGRAYCWGWSPRDVESIPPSTMVPHDCVFDKIWVGQFANCGRLRNGSESLVCWGDQLGLKYLSPPESLNLRASTIVDMTCSGRRCVAMTTVHESPVLWGETDDYYRPLVDIDHYDTIISSHFYSGASCAINSNTGLWHCMDFKGERPCSMTGIPQIPLKHIAYSNENGIGIMPNGSWVTWGCDFVSLGVPSADERFLDVCAQEAVVCGIRLNGTLVCGINTDPKHPDATGDKPWLIGATAFSDYVKIECSKYSSCAIRANGDAYCWGDSSGLEIMQPPVRGPWQKIQGFHFGNGRLDVPRDSYYGLLKNGSLYEWTVEHAAYSDDDVEVLDMSMNALDFTRSHHRDGRSCIIASGLKIDDDGTDGGGDDDSSDINSDSSSSSSSDVPDPTVIEPGSLHCWSTSQLPPLPKFAAPLNRSNQLTSDNSGTICVLIDGTMHCVGDEVKRWRQGGLAMAPRTSINRIIYIANPAHGDGVDAPLCGQTAYKPCGTITYAMSLVESVGPWVTFQLSYGDYELQRPISIDYAGITIQGRKGEGYMTRFKCDLCIVVNAPSFRVAHVTFDTGSTAITVNTGLVDIVVQSVIFRRIAGSAIQVLALSQVTIIDTYFAWNHGDGSAIYAAHSDITVISSHFNNNYSPSSGGAIIADSCNLVIHSSSFKENWAVQSGGCISVVAGHLHVINTQFMENKADNYGGAINIAAETPMDVQDVTEGSVVIIEGSSFTDNTAGRDGGAIWVEDCESLEIINGCTFTRNIAVAAGGALFIQAGNSPSPVFIRDTIMIDNGDTIGYLDEYDEWNTKWMSDESFRGAAIWCSDAQLTITNTSFLNHTIWEIDTRLTPSTQPGNGMAGVIYGVGGCHLRMSHVTASYNRAYSGAVVAGSFGGYKNYIVNSTFTHNTAAWGGVFALLDPRALPISGSVFEHNTASIAGAVYFVDTIRADKSTPDVPLFIDPPCTYVKNRAPFGNDDHIVAAPSWIVMNTEGTVPQTSGEVIDGPWFNATLKDSFGQSFATHSSMIDLTVNVLPLSSWSTRDGARRRVITPKLTGQTVYPLKSNDGTLHLVDLIVTGEPASQSAYQLRTVFYLPSMTPSRYSDTVDTRIYRTMISPAFNISLRGCAAGENTTSLSCIACPLGRYSNMNLAGDCTPCARGSYQTQRGATSCVLCDNGMEQSSTGATTCTQCVAGTYSVAGASSCMECGRGYYSAGLANSYCHACNPGSFTSRTGLTFCTVCNPGTIAMSSNSTGCLNCPKGWYQAARGQSYCTMCAVGTAGVVEGNVACATCGASYSFEPASTECHKCATQGMSCEGGIATIEENYWAWPKNGTQRGMRALGVVPCPKGKCLGGIYGTLNYTPCARDRRQEGDNIMCGACRDGFIEFGDNCVPCDRTSPGMIVLAGVAMFGLVIALHVSSQGSSGIQSAFFYFIQMAMFMLPSTEVWLSWLDVFAGGDSGGGGSVFGLCFAPLTPSEQMAFSVLSFPLLMAALAIVGLIQNAMTRWIFCGRCQQKLVDETCLPLATYWRSFVSIYLFSYSTLSNTLMGFLLCTEALGDKRIFTSPTISCNSDGYRRWFPIVVTLFIALVVVPPLGLSIYLAKNRDKFTEKWFRHRWGLLFEPYTPAGFYWGSMVLLRRVTFTLVDIALVALPSFKFMIFTFLHFVSLLVHILVRPYAMMAMNAAEMGTLACLVAISIMVATFPTPSEIKAQTSIQICISIVMLGPVVGFGIYFGKIGIGMIREKIARLRGKGSAPLDGDMEAHMLDDGAINAATSEQRHVRPSMSSYRMMDDDGHLR